MVKRTTMILPEELLAAAKRVSGKTSQTEVVCEALTAYVARKGVERLISARGKFPHLKDLTAEQKALARKRERFLDRLRRR